MYIWSTVAVLSPFVLYRFPSIVIVPYLACLVIIRIIYHVSCILLFDLRARVSQPETNSSSQSREDVKTERKISLQLEPFKYSPLPSERHIRLLRLHRPTRKTRRDHVISCELMSFPLDVPQLARPYRAVSYTW